MKLLLHLLTSLHGPNATSRNVRFSAALGVLADFYRRGANRDVTSPRLRPVETSKRIDPPD